MAGLKNMVAFDLWLWREKMRLANRVFWNGSRLCIIATFFFPSLHLLLSCLPSQLRTQLGKQATTRNYNKKSTHNNRFAASFTLAPASLLGLAQPGLSASTRPSIKCLKKCVNVSCYYHLICMFTMLWILTWSILSNYVSRNFNPSWSESRMIWTNERTHALIQFLHLPSRAESSWH